MNTFATRPVGHPLRLRRVLLLTAALFGVAGLSVIAHGGINGGGTARSTIIAPGVVRSGGVTYDLTGAQVRIDGEYASGTELAVGQLVTIQTVLAADGTSGVATQVSYDSDVRGAVSSVAAAGDSFVVLGQTVFVDGSTVIDAGSGSPADAAAVIATDRYVEVSGYRDASGQLFATRVASAEPARTAVTERLIGVVSNHDPYSLRFSINELQVDYSNVVVLNQAIGNGALVEVRGRRTASGLLRANTIATHDPSLGGAESEPASLQGIVTNVLSGNTIAIDGQVVVVRSGTRYFNGSRSALVEGARIRIGGRFDGNGRIVAQSVEFGLQ